MHGADKLDCLQIGHVHITILVSAAQKVVKSFIYSATKLQYHATVMVLHKQHLKCIAALAANGKRVAKRAWQSRKASSSPSNLDNFDYDNSINIIESQPQKLVF